MANSAYYGLSGRVANVPAAVSVLGLLTVRSLAAAAMASMTESDEAESRLPSGFWLSATTTATAAGLLAPRCGARRDDAFCVGILHDLGSALLRRHDPEGHVAVLAEAAARGRPAHLAEQAAYGTDHAEVGARVLAGWNFPAEMCDAIAEHHSPERATTGLARALRGARALAARMPGSPPHDPLELRPEALEPARIRAEEVTSLLTEIRETSRSLTAALLG